MQRWKWSWKKKKDSEEMGRGYTAAVQTGPIKGRPFYQLEQAGMMDAGENQLFDQIRQAVPLVDASINKIIRLVGGFEVICSNKEGQRELDEFCVQVPVGASSVGLTQFLYCYLDNLLTYGNAAGEMIPLRNGEGIGALYNVPLSCLKVKQGETPVGVDFFTCTDGVKEYPIAHPERILFTALNPKAGEIKGRSLLSGLPFVSSILLNIYQAIGQNFERMGNLRFAVTYNPQGNIDGAYAREIAQDMARQWADTMHDSGRVKDFIAVGDVNIRVIGADNQIIDTQVPVRQMLEQIVAKLGLPPFILGLSWSTTERMSQQQAEILASELESYRELLNSVIVRICRYHLNQKGIGGTIRVNWKHVSITDEVEQARAQLLRMQAKEIEKKLEKEYGEKAEEEEHHGEL